MDKIFPRGCYSFKITTGYILEISCAKTENNFLSLICNLKTISFNIMYELSKCIKESAL